MKGSIRFKITLWFSAALIVVVALAYFVILSASNQVIQKTIRDALIETVESNVDEVEFYSSMEEVDPYNDVDHFVQYGEGYLTTFWIRSTQFTLGYTVRNGRCCTGKTPSPGKRQKQRFWMHRCKRSARRA